MRTLNLSVIVLSLATLLLLTACYTIKTPQRDNLVNLNDQLSTLNGSYHNFTNNPEDTAISMMSVLEFKNKKEAYFSKKYNGLKTHVSLKAQGRKKLLVSLYQDSAIIAQTLLKGRIKNNYFSVRRRISYFGIPFLFHLDTEYKMQLGLGDGNQLYIDAVSARSGSFLLFWAHNGPNRHNFVFGKLDSSAAPPTGTGAR